MTPFHEMCAQLRSAAGQSRAAKTVEWYGWVMLLEGGVMLLFPGAVASLLHFPLLTPEGSHFLRLVGLLVGGLGMLYTVSGRTNAEGLVFASLLDRPLVPPIMAALWYFGLLPGSLALLFAVEDFGTFLWTLQTWRADLRAQQERARVGAPRPGRL